MPFALHVSSDKILIYTGQLGEDRLHLDAIPKKLQLSPDLVEALAAKKELCRAKFSDFLAYFQGERPPPSSPGPPEWVAVSQARCTPGNRMRLDAANFAGLVLGCIEAIFCK